MPTAAGHTAAIRAKKVSGTTVSDPSGNKIGQVEDMILDKLSNNIMFAVVSFGGFLGISEKYHPVPWSSLKYDKNEDSYIVDFTKEQLEAAPGRVARRPRSRRRPGLSQPGVRLLQGAALLGSAASLIESFRAID